MAKSIISIESLINNSCTWKTVYTYHNYGDNALLLLEAEDFELQVGNDKVSMKDLCDSVVSGLDDLFEVEMMYKEFMKEYPNQPFIVMDDNLSKAAEAMNDKLAVYKGDWDKFSADVMIFREFMTAVHLAVNNEQLAYRGSNHGWRSILNNMPMK